MPLTRDEAVKRLKQCGTCGRWLCYETCDHCYVDAMGAPSTPIETIAALKRAIEIGEEAKRLSAKLKAMLP